VKPMTPTEQDGGEGNQGETLYEDDFEQVESVDDLPDHPRDRVHTGWNPNAREFLEGAVEDIGEWSRHGRLHGLIVVAAGTAHVYAEDWGVAIEQACDHANSGDLRVRATDRAEEIWEADEDKLVKGWYYEHRDDEDADYPLFEVGLAGAGRFFAWGRDQAQLGEVTPKLIDTGDLRGCVMAEDWRADVDQVDVDRLAVGKRGLETMLEEADSDE